MSNVVKAVLGMILFSVWGPYLIYIWMVPSAVPGWATEPGMRRALVLSHDFEPTIITLGMGVMFTALVFVGMFRLTTGRITD